MLTTRLIINPRLRACKSNFKFFLLRKCRFMKRKKNRCQTCGSLLRLGYYRIRVHLRLLHTSYTTKSKNKGRSQKLCCESNTFYAKGCMENGGHSALKFCNK